MYKSIPVKYSVFHESENPIFGERVTFVKIDDEAAGEFFVLEQDNEKGEIQKIILDFEELQLIFDIVKEMRDFYNTVGEK